MNNLIKINDILIVVELASSVRKGNTKSL